MITSIQVDGFKTLSEFRLSLNPGLNILVGPNGAGKTNIVSFFEFLAHLVESGPSEATSRLGGAGAVFRRVTDTYQAKITATVTGIYSLDQDNPFGFRVQSDEEKGKHAQYEYSFALLFSNDLESVVFTQQRLRYKRTTSSRPPDVEVSATQNWDIDVELTVDQEMKTKAKIRNLTEEVGEFLPFYRPDTKNRVAAIRDAEEFLPKVVTPNTSIPSTIVRFNPRLMLLSEDITGGQTYNIIPSRVKLPEDSAKPPGISSDGSGLSATLYSLKRRNISPDFRPWAFFAPGHERALKRTTLKTLKGYFQLANTSIEDLDISNDPFNNQIRVSFLIKNGDYKATVPLSLMSDGTLKWMTLITAALTVSSVFSIEEPENYLHPQMQGQFIKIMREILFTERKHGCTLMTTHSETLLNHCKPSELIVVSLKNGRTVGVRCASEHDLSDEIEKTGFGLGYYYIAGALQND